VAAVAARIGRDSAARQSRARAGGAPVVRRARPGAHPSTCATGGQEHTPGSPPVRYSVFPISNRVPGQRRTGKTHPNYRQKWRIDDRESVRRAGTSVALTLPTGVINGPNLQSGMESPCLNSVHANVKARDGPTKILRMSQISRAQLEYILAGRDLNLRPLGYERLSLIPASPTARQTLRQPLNFRREPTTSICTVSTMFSS